jgi:hypothetical protein
VTFNSNIEYQNIETSAPARSPSVKKIEGEPTLFGNLSQNSNTIKAWSDKRKSDPITALSGLEPVEEEDRKARINSFMNLIALAEEPVN